MNYKLLIVNALTLLFWESQISAGSDSTSLVKEVVGAINPEKLAAESGQRKEFFEDMQALIIKMTINKGLRESKEMILQTARVMCEDEASLLDAIEEGLHMHMDENATKRHCRMLVDELKEISRKNQFKRSFQDVAKQVLYGDGEFKLNEVARSIINRFEGYAINQEDTVQNMRGVMDFVDFNDEESVKAMFSKAQRAVSPEEIIKFHLQGLNRMFGEQGGGRRGEQILIGGLQHHFKSGLAMGMTRAAAQYNIPHLNNPNKKPAIILISSENDLPINIQTMYKQCLEPKLQKTIRKSDIDPSQAAKYMREEFSRNGWHFLMFRINPDEFTFDDYQSMILGLEADDYEIIVCTIDYLAMISTKGIDGGGITGRDKQALFKRVRNFNIVHDIMGITPHQLSTEALAIERDRPNQFMDAILNRAYYNECKTIAQEVDFEANLQKQIVDGIAYLNLGRGKHRGVDNTPLKDQRCTYPFTDFGIEDDVLGEDRSMRKPGANRMSEGGGPAWNQTADMLEFVLN